MVILPIAFLDHQTQSVSPESSEQNCKNNFDNGCKEDDRFVSDKGGGDFD